jgi:predicted protein tyrosine phosphatase
MQADVQAEAVQAEAVQAEAEVDVEVDIVLQVCSEAEAICACQAQPRFDLIVSIDACTNMFEQAERAKVLALFEQHADRVVSFNFMDTCDELNMDGPRASDAREARSLGRSLRPGARVLVHCVAGVSRSPAFAMLMLEARGLSREQSLAVVKRIRPISRPNKLLLQLASELNELDLHASDQVIQ